MKKNSFRLLFGLLLLGGPVFAQNTVVDSFVYGGVMRTYRLYVPPAYDGSSRWPLVLNLHGYGSNSWEQNFYSNFQPIADTAHFITALPDGTYDQTGKRFWNAGFGVGVDDVGFLSALLDTLAAQYQIDPQRIYSTGMSNGGFMSYTLACALSGRIAAIASVTGTMTNLQAGTCAPTRPVPVMQIHGTADPTVPYQGGGNFQPIEDVVAYWAGHNQCPQPAVMTPVPDINLADSCTAERYDYAPGANGARVVFYKVLGGGHTWPGTGFIIGTTNQDFSASVEIWRFFNQYDLSGPLTGTTELEPVPTGPIVYPNPGSGNFVLSLPEKAVSIRLYTASGQWVGDRPAVPSLDMGSLPDGLYFLEIRTEEGVVRAPLVLQR